MVLVADKKSSACCFYLVIGHMRGGAKTKTKRSDDDVLADLLGASTSGLGQRSGLTRRSRRGRKLTTATRYSPPQHTARRKTPSKTGTKKTATKKAAKKTARKTATKKAAASKFGVSDSRRKKLMKTAVATKDYSKPLASRDQDDLASMLKSWGL